MVSEHNPRVAKVAAELTSLFRDENAHLAKFRRTRTLIRFIGFVGLLGAWVIAGTPWHWPSATAALFALAGGFLLGLSIAYDNSLESWPIIKPLLKDNAMELLAERQKSGAP